MEFACYQFVQRVLLVFMPGKYQPDYAYLRHVKTFRVHIFTAIQTMCSIVMWFIKTIAFTAIIFPLMVIHARRIAVDLTVLFRVL